MATKKQESMFIAVGYDGDLNDQITSGVYTTPEEAINVLLGDFIDVDKDTIQVIEFTPLLPKNQPLDISKVKRIKAS